MPAACVYGTEPPWPWKERRVSKLASSFGPAKRLDQMEARVVHVGQILAFGLLEEERLISGGLHVR